MTRVELTKLARRQLHQIAKSRYQAEPVYAAVERGLEQLAFQPFSGQATGGGYVGTRVISVGRPHIVIHHFCDEVNDRVIVLGFIDGRTADAPEP